MFWFVGFFVWCIVFDFFFKNSKFLCLLKTLHRSPFWRKSIVNFVFYSFTIPCCLYFEHLIRFRKNLKIYFFLNFEKNWKIPRMESKIKNFLIEKNKINKNKELLETKWTSKSKKKHNVLIQNCDLWSIPKGDRWNFTAEPFKVWHHGRSTKFSNSKKWKTQNYGKQQNKLSKKRNVLASKLGPVKDFK